MAMNVFVTGGAGYIGSICTEELFNAGHAVTVYDNLTEGHRSAVDPRAAFVPGRPEGRRHPERRPGARPDAIMHFAANALVGESMTNPKKYFHNNVVNGLKLLDAAVECGVKKFVFSSTCATYGPPDRVPMTEDLPQRPINPYGESKLMFEKDAASGIGRSTGWSSSPSAISTPPAPANTLANITASRRTSSPTCCRSPWARSPIARFSARIIPRRTAPASAITSTSVDLAQAHMLGLQPGKSGFYNLGNGDGYSVRQVIETCEKVTGKKIPTVEKPRRPAIRPGWWPPPTRPSVNWAGSPNFPSWRTLSPPPGRGM